MLTYTKKWLEQVAQNCSEIPDYIIDKEEKNYLLLCMKSKKIFEKKIIQPQFGTINKTDLTHVQVETRADLMELQMRGKYGFYDNHIKPLLANKMANHLMEHVEITEKYDDIRPEKIFSIDLLMYFPKKGV